MSSLRLTAFVTMTLLAACPLFAQPAATRPGAAEREELRRRARPLIERGLRFLESAQAADGGWRARGSQSDPAITALAAKAFIQHPGHGPGHAVSKRALALVVSYQQPDGGIYNPQVGYANYTTSVALMMLAAAKDRSLERSIQAAQNYLKHNQWDEDKDDPSGKRVDQTHVWYGGAGYGDGKTRPDLSNTQMMLEALHESGLPSDDPVYKKALCFISRCQMLGETNDQPFAQGARDGGFIYSPASGGESKSLEAARVENREFPRSYGSMTYAGFKSMLYAAVDRNDPRVQAAWQWIGRYYTLDQNPNMPGAQSRQGLFYYYHVFAKALRAYGESHVVDSKGLRHDWRADLVDKLAGLQRADGSWINTADRWMEDNPYLVTAYSVLALQEVLAETSR
ncbi:MAG: terpene cyclase/mutase family protein [Phycisphaerae bacterium]|jgi:squalene-hopene/tetraprenyl-beta-curcumene cyclase